MEPIAAGWIRDADELFRRGDARAALPLLERAYAETGWPGCLLNLGMAHHALGSCPTALDYYERFLDAEPYDERRLEVETALHELLQHCAPEPSGLPVSPERPVDAIAALPGSSARASRAQGYGGGLLRAARELQAPPPASWRSASRSWALAGVGLAGASAIASVLMLMHGERLEQQAQHLDARGLNPDNDARARSVDADGRRANSLALGFGLGSLALLGTSAAVFWLGAGRETTAPFVQAGLGVGGLSFSSRF